MDTSSPVVSVRNLSKAYLLYERSSDRLKEVMFPWRKRHKTFYALQDVSFDLHAGEHLGILGINGAGKSTLLQILTGVLAPTSGEAHVRGRIGALLELGAGFNPELTGRQNADFLLSMTFQDRRVIRELVDQVEAFADIGDFFDQPMKLYSSGMFVRVGFAANAVATPDILIVDEALAVGDVRFQKKCFDYIGRLKEQGTTFIYVTHDVLGAKNFCTKLIFLDKGRIKAEGKPGDVVTEYYRFLYPNTEPESPAVTAEADRPAEVEANSGGICPAERGKQSESDSRPEEPHAARVNGSDSIYRIKPDLHYIPWGAGGVCLKEMRIYGLEAPNILRHDELLVECDYAIQPQQINMLKAEHHVEPHMLVGLRFDSARGLTIFDLGNAALGTRWLLEVNMLEETQATLRFHCTLPKFYPGEYFLTPVVSMGTLHHFVALCGYDNLALLNIQREEVVLGILRPDFLIEVIS